MPGGRRRHGAAVDRDRSCARSAARRCARGSARPKARARRSGRRAPSARHRSRPAPLSTTAGRRLRQSRSSTARVARPAGIRRQLAADQRARQKLQPLDRVAVAAPGLVAQVLEDRRALDPARARPWRSRADRSRRGRDPRQRAQQRGIAACSRSRAAPASGPPGGRSAGRPSGARPSSCRPSRICSSFSSQRWLSSLASAVSEASPGRMPTSRSSPRRRLSARISPRSQVVRRGSTPAAS